MTYVSRRARITVPRWPNDFDPEFLFRVARRCDGRLKRLSSCHDLRAWINDNCIKNEYLLDLMSDGEVTVTPPLQLYGRFIPVPLLFNLLQNSGSENGPGTINWEEIVQANTPGGNLKGKDIEENALEPAYGRRYTKAGYPFGDKDKLKGRGVSPDDKNKAKGLGAPFEGTFRTGSGVLSEGRSRRGSGISSDDRDRRGPGISSDDRDRRGPGVSAEERDKPKGIRCPSLKEIMSRGLSDDEISEERDRPKGIRSTSPKAVGSRIICDEDIFKERDKPKGIRCTSPKLVGSRIICDEDIFKERDKPKGIRCTSPKAVGSRIICDEDIFKERDKPKGIRCTSPKLVGSRIICDDEISRYSQDQSRSRDQPRFDQEEKEEEEEEGEARSDYPSYKPMQRKWDPFEKMEYYTSGYASKDALVDSTQRRTPPNQSSIVMDDEYDNKKGKSMSRKSGSEGNLARVLWEKDMIEKNLFKSTCLLTKAVGKLEKIDNIIQVGNEEREKMRKGEIQEAFHSPAIDCIYLQGKNNPENTPIKYRVRSLGEQERQDTLKCSELLRQISGLREKLKKNQECQQKVNEEMTMSQREAESGASPHMADLNTDGEAQLRKLQKRLEKLINHRGKLLSEMCQALTQLNNLKRSKNSRVDMRQRTRSGENRISTFRQELSYCGCKNCQSCDSEKANYSDSGSSSTSHFRRQNGNLNNRDDDKNYPYYTSTDNVDSGQQNLNNASHPKTNAPSEAYTSNGEVYKDTQTLYKEREKELKKSILRFCCPDPPCKQDPDADTDTSERYLPSGQSSPNRGARVGRPSTSPTTKREKRDASEEPRFVSYGNSPQEIPERRVKSETTMKEIEKTLRNYEQRLNDMDGLEYKVEEWKRKLLEACKWKKNASKVETQLKREQENERNRASIEINGLFSQNYELKKQVRQLMDKSKEQAKKIQNMKTGILKARELESETEELKKELTEYRNSYEHQRKCISKWESVVALQRKEIENLMNHIRKLTTEKKEQMTACCQDRKCVHRTRSCSPVTLVECQTYCRPETYNPRSDEENGSCCCQDFRQSDSRRSQLRVFDGNYYSSLNERDDWCT